MTGAQAKHTETKIINGDVIENNNDDDIIFITQIFMSLRTILSYEIHCIKMAFKFLDVTCLYDVF